MKRSIPSPAGGRRAMLSSGRALSGVAAAVSFAGLLVLLSPPARAQTAPAPAAAESNTVIPHAPYPVSARARALHATIPVADLHADPLLSNRDLLQRSTHGHIDIPRLQDGGFALQDFSVVTKSPRGSNYVQTSADAPDDMTDRIKRDGWPPRTWNSILQRALFLADKLKDLEKRSGGAVRVVRTKADLRRARQDHVIAGILLSEGAHPLEGKLSNVQVMYDAGFRVLGLTHFFDNEVGGSLHGVSQAGLTAFGRQVIPEAEAKGMIIDVAHASEATVRDTLAISKRPVILSHTGVKGYCDTPRNVSDATLKAIADRGGLIGVGYWDAAVCKPTMKNVTEAITYAVKLLGPEHVALGSDFDGGTVTPFDASEMPALTSALLDAGLDEKTVRLVMGENAMRFFSTYLPGQ
ncbi:MAG TPA: dipeptidase [Phenylobacterium sp.]|nr:dipeptidase [Phenylobacterium sp.]